MREIKVKFPHYWIELPADAPLIELARALEGTRLRLRWNNRLKDCTGRSGFIEIRRNKFKN